VSTYAALTARGAVVDGITAEDPAAGMRAAAERCGPDDYPVTLYATDPLGALVRPVWGGRRGFAGVYPPGESPEDAARLFGPGTR
jgi:hypothetical protein